MTNRIFIGVQRPARSAIRTGPAFGATLLIGQVPRFASGGVPASGRSAPTLRATRCENRASSTLRQRSKTSAAARSAALHLLSYMVDLCTRDKSDRAL